ncbi:MAG: hypothetical protein ACYS47_21925, partial [Planctomycetota bacterium]
MKVGNVAPLVILVFLFACLSTALAVEVPKDPKEALELGRAEKQKGLMALNRARKGGPDESKLSKKAMKHLEAAQACYGHYLDSVEEDEKAEEEMSDL